MCSKSEGLPEGGNPETIYGLTDSFQFCKDGENNLAEFRFIQYARQINAAHEVFVMIVTAWKNGSPSASGAGYGVRLAAADRDSYFQKEWETIELELQGYAQVVKVNVSKPSFWNSKCRELIHAEIGRWLIENGLSSWQGGNPPKLSLKFIGGNRFRLMR